MSFTLQLLHSSLLIPLLRGKKEKSLQGNQFWVVFSYKVLLCYESSMKRFWYAKSKYGLWKALYVPKLLGRGIRKRGFPLFFLLFKRQEIRNVCMSFLKSQLFMESSTRSICSINYVNHDLSVWLIRGEIILFTLLFKNRKQEIVVCLFFEFVGNYGWFHRANNFFNSWEKSSFNLGP